MHGALEQLALKRLRNCRFPSAGQPGEPHNRAAMPAAYGTMAGGNFSFGPKNVFALCNLPVGIDAAENDTSSANLVVIDDCKSAEIRDAVMIVDHEWTAGLNRQPPDLISLHLFALVDLCLERR